MKQIKLVDDMLPIEYPLKEMAQIYLKRLGLFVLIVVLNLSLLSLLILIVDEKALVFFFTTILVGALLFPIFGLSWIWVYRMRQTIGLPDWLSGMLAQGIISGHNVSSGNKDRINYGFIILATLATTSVVLLLLFLLLYILFG